MSSVSNSLRYDDNTVKYGILVAVLGFAIIAAISVVVIGGFSAKGYFGCSFPLFSPYVIGSSIAVIILGLVALAVVMVVGTSPKVKKKPLENNRYKTLLNSLSELPKIIQRINTSKIKVCFKRDLLLAERQINIQLELLHGILESGSDFNSKQILEIADIVELLCFYNSKIKILMFSSKTLYKNYTDLIDLLNSSEKSLLDFVNDIRRLEVSQKLGLDWSCADKVIAIRDYLRSAKINFLTDRTLQQQLLGIKWKCLLKSCALQTKQLRQQAYTLQLLLKGKTKSSRTIYCRDYQESIRGLVDSFLIKCKSTARLNDTPGLEPKQKAIIADKMDGYIKELKSKMLDKLTKYLNKFENSTFKDLVKEKKLTFDKDFEQMFENLRANLLTKDFISFSLRIQKTESDVHAQLNDFFEGLNNEDVAIAALDRMLGEFKSAQVEIESCVEYLRSNAELSEEQINKLMHSFMRLEVCNNSIQHSFNFDGKEGLIKDNCKLLEDLLNDVKFLGVSYIKGSSCKSL